MDRANMGGRVPSQSHSNQNTPRNPLNGPIPEEPEETEGEEHVEEGEETSSPIKEEVAA